MKKKLCLCLLALVMPILLVGCLHEEMPPDDPGISLVIIVGKHANANCFTEEQLVRVETLLTQAFRLWSENDGIDNTLHAQAQIKIIVSDGRPVAEQIMLDEKTVLESEIVTNTVNARTKRIEDRVKALMDYLRSDALRAGEEEVDLLGAISEAKTILDITPGGESHILILDTGICTVGKANMVRNDPIDIYQESPLDFIQHIPEDGFPNLEGVQVTFWGMGNVASPQIDYRSNNRYKQWLLDVWTEILTDKCKGILTEEILFSESAGDPMMWFEDGTGSPRVKSVFFVDTIPTAPNTEETVEPVEASYKGTGVSTIPTSALGFLPDSIEFQDEAEAIRVLEPYVTQSVQPYLESDPENNKIYVVGSIARITPDEDTKKSHTLSLGRATRVAEILVQYYHVPQDSLVIVDAGTSEFSWRPGHEFIDGELNRENQQSSRMVALIPSSAAEVSELRQQGYIR